MIIPIIYIGVAQALFAALVIFLKKPLKIADVILACWLIALAAMFGLNIYQEVNKIKEDMWFFSLSLSMSFPPFLYLYSKYITVEFRRFILKDFLHVVPIILTVLLILIFSNYGKTESLSDSNNYRQLDWLRNYVGGIFVIQLWVYGILAVKNVMQYKKQIRNNYSYSSDKISLNWLLVVVVSFILFYNLIIAISTLQETELINQDIDLIRNTILLVYVYVVSLWGYRQSQLTSDVRQIKSNTAIPNENEVLSGKYKKSGLKHEQANKYIQKLIHFMNEAEVWKDPELSVSKLSLQTNIPKHHITQVLNENIGKNFYLFVNEYRVEYAKKLLLEPGYASWSIVAIAYECGFNSKTAFNNFFKKHTGNTPSEYKQKNEL